MAQRETLGHMRVVAVAVDGSRHSDEALNFYLNEIQREGDYLVIIHSPEWYDLTDASPAVADRLIREMEESVMRVEKKYMNLLKEKHANLKGKFRTHGGKPGEAVCKVAEEEGATIIVCGTRGQGTVRRTIMGSVSDYIIHHTKIPVLVCKARQ